MCDIYHPTGCACDACVAKRARRAERQKPITPPPAAAQPATPTPPEPPPASPAGAALPIVAENVDPPAQPVNGATRRTPKLGHSHFARTLLSLMQQHQLSGKAITRRSTDGPRRFPSSYLSRILSGPQVYVNKGDVEGLARLLSNDPREHFALCHARLRDECPERYQSRLQIRCTLDLAEGEAAYPFARLSRWGRAGLRASLERQPAAFEALLEALAATVPPARAEMGVNHFATALNAFMAQQRVTGKELTRRTAAAGRRLPSSWISRITSGTQTWLKPETLELLIQQVTTDPLEQAELVRAYLYDQCPPFAFPLVRVVLAEEDRRDETPLQQLSLRGRQALSHLLNHAAQPEATFKQLAHVTGLN